MAVRTAIKRKMDTYVKVFYIRTGWKQPCDGQGKSGGQRFAYVHPAKK